MLHRQWCFLVSLGFHEAKGSFKPGILHEVDLSNHLDHLGNVEDMTWIDRTDRRLYNSVALEHEVLNGLTEAYISPG